MGLFDTINKYHKLDYYGTLNIIDEVLHNNIETEMSIAKLTYSIVDIRLAKKNLNNIQFSKFSKLFDELLEETEMCLYVDSDLLSIMIIDILSRFDEIAPVEKYICNFKNIDSEVLKNLKNNDYVSLCNKVNFNYLYNYLICGGKITIPPYRIFGTIINKPLVEKILSEDELFKFNKVKQIIKYNFKNYELFNYSDYCFYCVKFVKYLVDEFNNVENLNIIIKKDAIQIYNDYIEIYNESYDEVADNTIENDDETIETCNKTEKYDSTETDIEKELRKTAELVYELMENKRMNDILDGAVDYKYDITETDEEREIRKKAEVNMFYEMLKKDIT